MCDGLKETGVGRFEGGTKGVGGYRSRGFIHEFETQNTVYLFGNV